MLFITLASVASAASEGNTEYFYLNSETGNDKNSGSDETNALKTFARAYRLAEASKAKRACIVVTNEYKIVSSLAEAVHKTPFVITTNDGKTDYGAKGAKLVFGKGLRYILNGDTTFENIVIEYTTSLNFVAQYNPITFAKGVEHNRLDNSDSAVYIVGGWQSPASNKAVELDSHITVESGSFAYVIGGSRQNAGGSELSFTGTHYITVNGGNISTLYAGSMRSHKSGNAVINVNGGKINSLYFAGDEARAMQGDVTASFAGGKLLNVYVNNVIGNVKVFLLGATVENMDVSYFDPETEKAHGNSGGVCELYYKGVYDNVKAYTGFENVYNDNVVYAAEGANGGGASKDDPAAFAGAVKLAAENGGTVKVVGKIKLGDFSEPLHGGRIYVTGATEDAAIEVSGAYVLGGETVFSDISLGGNFDASEGVFETKANVTSVAGTDITVTGSAIINSGNIADILNAKNVVIYGGKVTGSITGEGNKVSITLYGGDVGTVKTAETSVKSFSMAQFGGSVGKVVFCNVTEALSYHVAGGKVSEYASEGNCVKGKLTSGIESFTLDSLSAAASLFDLSGEQVFFICDGAKGSGKSALDPSDSIADAYSAVKENGGTVVICGPYTLAAEIMRLKNSMPVVITSEYNGVDYAKQNKASFTLKADFLCGGDTEWRNITLAAGAANVSIYANCNKVHFCDSIVSVMHGESGEYLSIVGGRKTNARNQTVDLIVDGGVWQSLTGGSYNLKGSNTPIELTVNGGEFIEYVTLGSNVSYSGDINARINGGTFYQGIYASAFAKADQKLDSNVTLEINGGTVYGYVSPAFRSSSGYLGSYAGSFNVKLAGGDLAHVTKIMGAEVCEGTMTSTISISEAIDIDAPFKGKTEFTNPLKVKSDPWLFYHDGYYYLTGSAAYGITVCKAPNISDLRYALYEKVYTSSIKSNWSAEIHHFTDEEVGAGNGGWYCYIGSPEDGVENATRRMYVIKCLDGDDLMGRWGNPVTGEVNVPQRVMAPDVEDYVNWWGAGQSSIRINGKVYALFVSEVGRETAEFHQTINIMEMENPWTLKGEASVICVPGYDWEKHGYSYNPNATGKKAYPAVVEGATALYGDDGSVFLTYTGSGVWTTEYQIGYMKYIGGDPLDPASWKKNPTSILHKSEEINGTGHGSFVTDTSGKTWIAYHAYEGIKADGDRYVIMEPVVANKNGVTIGNGSGSAAPLATVYEEELNPLPLAKRISGFDSIDRFVPPVKEPEAPSVDDIDGDGQNGKKTPLAAIIALSVIAVCGVAAVIAVFVKKNKKA